MPSTPILRLPVELHLEIANLLDLGDNVRLASTDRYFRSIIPAPTHSEFLAAEECAWARSKQLYACKCCVNFHTWEKFADNMRKGKWCRSGTHANERFCLKCGVNSALYARGTLLTICNRPHVLCSKCGSLTDQLGHHGMCAACSPDTKRNRGSQHFDHEDHWTYATNRMSDRNHVREFYNWPEDGRLPRF
ncbi:F-box domain containing protein [Pyrenophora tritici-repentis Pt-1C-BFP]|uniref:F-box domain containing protein n=1 Tax=Pyrenophora tritici-repentis (strain Pt-1C-BFP) TaxID=426418 RepID=B2W6Y1_PYRTR|nr:F-box domain containing protein [Pyrenophora tritici-repentis Pt-1C-BFP]EDU48489.1 F-box domain containing protein [Pyrenophora tritici-repentis Pt-1C-BFP]